MDLLFHTPDTKTELSQHYRRAFSNSVELFIVTAYLTDWDSSLALNPRCRLFRLIIGKDFGITRKAACEIVMRWLPSNRKGQFMVADRIGGFHPKAVLWKEESGKCFAIVGSSNLTRAAFETNYEANIICSISVSNFKAGKKWVKDIEKQSVVVSEDWLKKYKESRLAGMRGSNNDQVSTPLVAFKLPTPRGMKEQISLRRNQLISSKKRQRGLIRLFHRCARGEISSAEFYKELPKYWSYEKSNRLQGAGWERQGKDSNFQLLSRSFLNILNASDEDRDDVVIEEIDSLSEQEVPTRKAFLSEMLCLRFPEEYPVLNKPVLKYLQSVKFRAPRGRV